MEKDMQRKYLQMQLLKQQLNALLEEKAFLDEKLSELMMSLDASKKLDRVKKSQTMWSPLGSGSFVQSEVKDTENIMISVGAGVLLKKKRIEAIEILKGRVEELRTINQNLVTEINRYNEQINKIEYELQEAVQKENK